MSSTYVVGHKNPDTDSIVSAIAYAEYKKQLGFNCVAARLGSVNKETEYLLDKFGFEDPIRVYTAKSTLKEIDKDSPALVSENITMKKALDRIVKLKNRGLIVVDEKKRLEGVVTLDDLTYVWTKNEPQLEKTLKTITVKGLLEALNGKVIIENKAELSGKLHLFPSIKTHIHKQSIVLLRNENDKLSYSIKSGASILIVITSSPINTKIINQANKAGVTIITTEMSPLDVSRYIYQSPTIKQIMVKKDKIIHFNENDMVDEVAKKIAKSRHRSYPVLNDRDEVVGAVSRYHLFNYEKKKFILVDHNEMKQTVDEIENDEILEIIDHHRFGGFETDNPINIKTEVLGATSTIIAKMYLENSNVRLTKNMASILLGAIISDTMNFKSPTTTNVDIEIKEKLEKIAKLHANDLSKEMIANSESILSKRMIEIVYNDFKEFNYDSNRIGVAQDICKSKQEYNALKNNLKQYLVDACKTNNYDLLVVMLTNPNGSGSYLIYAGNKSNIIERIYSNSTKDGFVEKLVSRKKQLLPFILKELNQ